MACQTSPIPSSGLIRSMSVGPEGRYGIPPSVYYGFPLIEEENIYSPSMDQKTTSRQSANSISKRVLFDYSSINGQCFIQGSGSVDTPPVWAYILNSIGYNGADRSMSDSYDYNYIGLFQSLSFKVNHHGTRYVIPGARISNFSINGSYGEPVVAAFTGAGLLASVDTESNMEAADWRIIPPRLKNANAYIRFKNGDTVSFGFKSFSLNMSMSIVQKAYGGTTPSISIIKAIPPLDIDWGFIVELKRGFDWVAMARLEEKCELSITVGEETGNMVKMSLSDAHCVGVAEGIVEGIRVKNLRFSPVGSSVPDISFC